MFSIEISLRTNHGHECEQGRVVIWQASSSKAPIIGEADSVNSSDLLVGSYLVDVTLLLDQKCMYQAILF